MFSISLLRNKTFLLMILSTLVFSTFNSNTLFAQVPADGSLDNSLNTTIDIAPGNVSSSAIQTDGKLVIGGQFKSINGTPHKSLVRLNTDNSIDNTFSASVNGLVLAIAIQPDGKIVIGGDFTVVNGVLIEELPD